MQVPDDTGKQQGRPALMHGAKADWHGVKQGGDPEDELQTHRRQHGIAAHGQP